MREEIGRGHGRHTEASGGCCVCLGETEERGIGVVEIPGAEGMQTMRSHDGIAGAFIAGKNKRLVHVIEQFAHDD